MFQYNDAGYSDCDIYTTQTFRQYLYAQLVVQAKHIEATLLDYKREIDSLVDHLEQLFMQMNIKKLQQCLLAKELDELLKQQIRITAAWDELDNRLSEACYFGTRNSKFFDRHYMLLQHHEKSKAVVEVDDKIKKLQYRIDDYILRIIKFKKMGSVI